jgi:hypothetical protein
MLVDVVVRYTGYDGSVDPSDTETGFVCKRKYAKLNELQDVISNDLDWRAYVEVKSCSPFVAFIVIVVLTTSTTIIIIVIIVIIIIIIIIITTTIIIVITIIIITIITIIRS